MRNWRNERWHIGGYQLVLSKRCLRGTECQLYIYILAEVQHFSPQGLATTFSKRTIGANVTSPVSNLNFVQIFIEICFESIKTQSARYSKYYPTWWTNPSRDPRDFLSSSGMDLGRILQGTALFSWGNEQFLETACNWEVFWILTRFEARCFSEDTLLSIPFESGSWSGGPKILEETCN